MGSHPLINEQKMRFTLIALVVALASALSAQSLAPPRLAQPRVAALAMSATESAEQVQRELDECIVDAENPDELAACMEPVAEAPKRSLNPIKAIKSLFSKGKKAKLELDAEDIDECVVNSESAEEREQCQ